MGGKNTTALCCSPEQHSVNFISNESSIRAYPDDDPLVRSSSLSYSCTLELDHLDLKFKPFSEEITLDKSFSRCFPVLIELVPPSLPEKQGLDLLFLIELSSFSNPWLESVKKCINYAVPHLNTSDRVCVIGFNDSALKLIPFTTVSPHNQSKIINSFSHLQGSGGCCLNEGLSLSLNVLSHRRMSNTATALVIFSQSQSDINKIHDPAEHGISNLFVYVFGLGEHSSENMSSLSEGTGCYYNIPHPSTLIQAFGSCFGELMTLYVDQLQVNIETIRSAVPVSLEKVYGYRKHVTYGKPAKICVVLNILPCSTSFKPNFLLKLLKVQVKYRIIPSGEHVNLERDLEIPIFNSDKAIENEENYNSETVVEVFRVKFADMLYEALFESSESAREGIRKFLTEIQEETGVKDSLCVFHIVEECKSFEQFLVFGWNKALKARMICSLHGFMNRSLFYYNDFQNEAQIVHQSSLKELIRKRS